MKRWPIIRHIRYAYLRWRFECWWHDIGHRLGAAPNPSDIDYLERVRRGEV